MKKRRGQLSSIEICAGAGGQALGLERANFFHEAVWEIDPDACATLRKNRPEWNTILDDITQESVEQYIKRYEGKIDLFAGGVPCPPFSLAGKQLGEDDERDLFPTALKLVRACKPRAIMLENVRGILSSKFEGYRARLIDTLENSMDVPYKVVAWELLSASDFGVPQLRPRAILVAVQEEYEAYFDLPAGQSNKHTTVGEALYEEMNRNGWRGVDAWKEKACTIGPTLVGGSKKHGGPDLGPTRAKREWEKLGVNAHSIAEDAPDASFEGNPRLTVEMAAVLQGFDKDWKFQGTKTSRYRQVGNAFPPPVAEAVGRAIADTLQKKKRNNIRNKNAA